MAATLLVGESLVGEGNEVAHIDLLIGSKSGPVGEAFANALVNQKEGHTNLLAVVAPNLPAKPDTIMSNKVTIKGATQAVQMFGPAQAAVARAVVDSVREGVIAEGDVDDLCIIVGVFIHWEATDDKKIFDYNYQATKESIARALANEPSVSDDPRLVRGGAPPVRRRASRASGHVGPIATGRPGRLAGLHAVVTGASSGIGRAIAETYRRRGSRGAAHAPRSPERAREVADAIAARGGRALVAPGRPRDARRAASASSPRRASELGRLDVWVNNAGADVLTGEAAAWEWERKLDALLAVDLKGTIACSYAAGEVMRGQERGGDDRQHELGPRHDRHGRREPAAVRRRQGRRAGVQQEPRARPGARRARQRPVPGLDRDRASASTPIASSTARSRRPRRWGAGAARRTWRTRRSTSPRPRRRSSPARRSTSTAAS